jgi:AAA domain
MDHAAAPRPWLLHTLAGRVMADDAAATVCLTCGVNLLERDHLDWCPHRVKERPNGESTIVRVDNVKRERVRWLWSGRIPCGKLVILDGDPALGKSTMTLDWSARVSTGSPWPDGSTLDGPGAVLIVSGEDGVADTIRPRLEAHGADLSRVYCWDHVTEGERERPPSLPADLEWLEAHVHETGAVLVVIDPFAAFLSSRVDSHRDQDVRGALMPLARLAERTGAAIVVIRHLTKAGGANPLYRGGGSVGIIGAARAGMLVAPDPEDEGQRILCMTKSNLAEMPAALAYRLVSDVEHDCGRIVWAGPTEHRASDLLGQPRSSGGDDETAVGRAVQFLMETLDEGPVWQRDLQEQAGGAGLSWMSVRRAKDVLGVVSRKASGDSERPGQWYWTYGDGTRDDAQGVQGVQHGELDTLSSLPSGDGPGVQAAQHAQHSEPSTLNTLLPEDGSQ